jgi:pyrroline-5-carboxylate reductase
MKLNKKIGFLGCGNMGEAILAGLLKNRAAQASHVTILESDKRKAKAIVKKYKVKNISALPQLCQKSNVIILAIKPQQLKEVSQILKSLLTRQHLVISILAGTTTVKLKKMLGHSARFVRVMPNLGASVGESCTALAQNSPATPQDLKTAQGIFESCGNVIFLAENKLNLVTALSGSGPAYFFYLAECLMTEGQRRGLSQAQARALVVQTAFASGLLMRASSEHPRVLKERVTSKKGTTEAALKALAQKGWAQAMHQAIEKAVKRAAELSQNR